MGTTIEDIAKDAGVSTATVSRVLNGFSKVSAKSRQKVEESIKKYNYRPNAAARSLITNKSGLVAVIQPDINNPIIAKAVKEIADRCKESGRVILISDYNMNNADAIKALDVILERNVDGVVFFGISFPQELIEKLKQFSCPVVLANQEIPNNGQELPFTTVTSDNYNELCDATEFLIRDNHKKIGFIGGPKEDYSSVMLRYKGYSDTMKKHGLDIPKTYVSFGEFTPQGGYMSMKEIYENSITLPTAIICCSDVIAAGCIKFIQNAGLKCPDDISVFGHDNANLDFFDMELTTIGSSDNGKIICDQLFSKDHDEKKGKKVFYPYRLFRRQSTKPIKD